MIDNVLVVSSHPVIIVDTRSALILAKGVGFTRMIYG